MTYRSMLFVPGDQPHRITRALHAGADAVVLDLEDAVAPEQHAAARQIVASQLGEMGADRWVRTLALGSPEADLDLQAVVRPGLAGVVLPGVDDPVTVRMADERIGELEAAAGMARGSVRVLPLTESALGLHRAFDILSASQRVTVAAFPGATGGDLCADLGADPAPGGIELLHARSHLLLEARAAGVCTIIDSVWADLDDHGGFRADTSLGRRLGFTGRFAIHPSQIPVLHDLLTVSPAEVAEAREVVAAYAAARRAGHGAVKHRGALVDRAMAARAERLLAAVSPAGPGR